MDLRKATYILAYYRVSEDLQLAMCHGMESTGRIKALDPIHIGSWLTFWRAKGFSKPTYTQMA